MQTETPSQQRKRLEKRNRYRGSVCSGCHSNYYNYAQAQSANGDVAVEETYSCWHLDRIKRGKCTCYSKY